MSGRVDLHVHSLWSDGNAAPAAIVRAARERGLAAVAVSDHDSVAGCEEAVRAGLAEGVEVVSAVEISAGSQGIDVHVLGYFVDWDRPGLARLLARAREARLRRAAAIVAKLRDMGVEIAEDDVLAEAGAAAPGRTHVARALVRRGVADDEAEAFKLFLARGRPGFAERDRPSPEEAAAAISDAGGVAVLAHPGTIRCGPESLRLVVERLADAGLEGVEAWRPGASEEETRTVRLLALKYGLALSGGSNAHRLEDLGRAPEGLPGGVGYEALENLRRRRARR